jgi:hypothetical protein
VYANIPARDQLYLLVTDVQGRLLQRKTVVAEKGDNFFKLDISRLGTGLYYVQVFGSDGLHKTLMAEKR